MSEPILIRVKDVVAGYENQIVLQNINMEVHQKDFTAIIGPNGGGKTTLLRIILGLLEPMEGEVCFFNSDGTVSTSPHIGYLPQHATIDRKFPISVKEVLLSGISRKGYFGRGKEDLEKVEKIATRFGVLPLLNRPIGKLSGGQLQRVFLGRAVISKPDLLILDEPNTYVDKNFEKELYEILNQLQKEMAILLVSHDIGTISAYVQNIACVNRTLHFHPAGELTTELLASYNCPIDVITHGRIPHRVLRNHLKH